MRSQCSLVICNTYYPENFVSKHYPDSCWNSHSPFVHLTACRLSGWKFLPAAARWVNLIPASIFLAAAQVFWILVVIQFHPGYFWQLWAIQGLDFGSMWFRCLITFFRSSTDRGESWPAPIHPSAVFMSFCFSLLRTLADAQGSLSST